MIKENFNLDYKDFVKQYVTSPIYDFTKGKIYQFDFVGVPKNKDGSTAYDFVSYESDWNSPSQRQRFKSLKEAIDNVYIGGMKFEEIYNSSESDLIDVS